MTSPDRWQRIKELYNEAVGLTPLNREAFLRRKCADDESLRTEVERLLAEEQAGTFLGMLLPLEMRPGPVLSSNPPPTSGLVPGQTIGHYRLEEKLGEGGMGIVYRALDIHLDRPVALKFLSPSLVGDEEARRRFVSEAKAAAAIDHPNICAVYEIRQTASQTFIAMPYLHGETLRERIGRGSLPPEEALRIAMEVAAGLDAAHRGGIIHRDIKPANLMLVRADSSGSAVKILDFGLARLAGSQITRTNMILGTLAYMSPEQAVGKNVDQRTDLWALGVVLYEMLAGRRPFLGDCDRQVMDAIANSKPALPTEVNPGLPNGLNVILVKALAKKPEDRFQSAREFRERIVSLTAASPGVSDRKAQRAKRAIAWGVSCIVATVFLAILLWIRWPSSQSHEPFRRSPLTTYPGAEQDPTFSPDGSQVAFAWNGQERGDFDIYVKVVGSEQSLRITNSPLHETSPAWSPDGGRIAFTRLKPSGGSELFLISPLGGAEQKVVDLASPPKIDYHAGISWSPDGKYLAVEDSEPRDSALSIYLVSVETGNKRRVTEAPKGSVFGDLQPQFSPDGRDLAFQRSQGFRSTEICTVPATGGSPRVLTRIVEEPFGLAWTADGQEILYGSRPDGLFRIPRRGGKPTHVSASGEAAFSPAVASVGRRLAFEQFDFRAEIWRLDRMDPDCRQPALLASTRGDGAPRFSPDGARIAFCSYRTGTMQLWVCDRDGANPVRLTNVPYVGSPAWSPDGAEIAFDCTERGSQDIFVVSSKGGPPRQVTVDPAEDKHPNWSADGRWMYFTSTRSGSEEIWKLGLVGEQKGLLNQLTQAGGSRPIETPDGKSILFMKKQSLAGFEIWRMSVDGSEPQKLVEFEANYSHWAVSGKNLLYINRRPGPPEETWGLFQYSFENGEIAEIAELEHRTVGVKDVGLTVSPDGRWILGTRSVIDSDLILVEGFR